MSVVWDTTNEAVGNITGSGPSVTFKAMEIGTCDITADFMGQVQKTIHITVKDKTAPSADAGLGGTITEGENFSFDASASSDNGKISDYHWDFGDGMYSNSMEATMDHTYDQPGDYTVTLTITDGGGNIGTDTITVIVLDITAPIAVAHPPESPDEDIPCFFNGGDSSDNVGIVLYIWDFGDGNQYLGSYGNVTHIYEMSGTYTVTLSVKDAVGHEDSTSSEVTVKDTTPPHAPRGLSVNPLNDGTTLEIFWETVTDSDLDHYELYVSENGGPFEKEKDDIDKASTKFTHTGLSMEKSYKYYLIAVDSSQNPSSNSPVVEGFCDIDTDSDGILDLQDKDDDDDGLSDYREVEEATDPKDPDSDDDRHLDGEDAFPLDKNEWKDTDFDGVGDSEDAFPKDATEWKDSDGDGIGDSNDFMPIPDLLFYIIIMVVVAVVLVAVDKMVQKRHQRKYIEAHQAQETTEEKSSEETQEPGEK
jgi:PKD repeat protein